MRKYAHGFTLIELMITIAIIGILASVAVPQYGVYTNRAKMAEAISITHQAKQALIIEHTIHGRFPAGVYSGNLDLRNGSVGLNPANSYASEYVDAMWVGAYGDVGHIVVKLNASRMNGVGRSSTPMLRSTVSMEGSSSVFECNIDWGHGIKSEYLPSAC